MSDVWQGPGWWLASDGKWYPADAEPGSPADESGSVQTKVEPPSTKVETTTSTIIETPRTEPEPTATFTEPVVEPFDAGADTVATGGWQSIVQPTEPAQPAEPWTEPADVTDTAGDDDGGWSSGYEERGSVHAEVTPFGEPAVPPAPSIPITEPVITDAVLPDLEPTETFAAEIPDLPIPDVDVPEVVTPQVPVPGIEVPNVQVPEVPSPDLAMPEVPPPAAPGVDPISHEIPEVEAPISVDMANNISGDQSDEIHREGAWRKPNGATETVLRVPDAEGEGDGTSAAPDVVDLAIPSESPLHPPIETARNGPSIGLLGAAAVVAVIVGLALLIAWLFTRGDDGELAVDDTPTVTASSSSTPTTESSAPTTEPESSTSTVTQDEEVSVFDLRAGDCIKNEIGQGQVQRLVRVDCAIPHEFEVYREALIDSTITEFDDDLISAQAQEVCGTSLADYISPSDTRDLKFKWFQPTEDSWNQEEDPDRVITCLLFDDAGPLTGRAA